MSRHSFSSAPSVRFNRSRFDLSHGKKTAFNVGELVPLDVMEVLPGDTFKQRATSVIRVTSSFIKPIMDNLYMEKHSFFVPYRLVYENSERVFGNPNPSAYTGNVLADMPMNEATWTVQANTVGDYLGLPVGKQIPADSVNVLAFRAFALIYDQWFRNENIIDEMYVQKGVATSSERPNNGDWSPNNYFGKLPKVGKKKDYFTSCLPQPQKGQPVVIPLGGVAPVFGDGTPINVSQSGDDGITFDRTNMNLYIGNVANQAGVVVDGGVNSITNKLYFTTRDEIGGNFTASIGALADLSQATMANVNDLRFGFQLQKMLERDSRFGSRYNEYLLGHFGVYSPDSRLQFTEYLGGGRFPLSIQQVAQSSESTETSPLANVGGYSLSNGYARFTKGFTEHGLVMTVGFIRQIHTYQDGIDKMFMRKSRNDFYDPLYANLGEQPVYTSELFVPATGQGDVKGNVFGYNEAWAEYRYRPSGVTGQMRSNVTNSLDIWHLADNYASRPYLNKEFIEENPTNVDRTVSVSYTEQSQFICDIWFDTKAIRVLPTYSVPGLIDHH